MQDNKFKKLSPFCESQSSNNVDDTEIPKSNEFTTVHKFCTKEELPSTFEPDKVFHAFCQACKQEILDFKPDEPLTHLCPVCEDDTDKPKTIVCYTVYEEVEDYDSYNNQIMDKIKNTIKLDEPCNPKKYLPESFKNVILEDIYGKTNS